MSWTVLLWKNQWCRARVIILTISCTFIRVQGLIFPSLWHWKTWTTNHNFMTPTWIVGNRSFSLTYFIFLQLCMHGVGHGHQNSIRTLDGALPSASTQRHRSTQWNIMVMRTVQASDMVLVTKTEEGTYLPKSGSEENKMATWLNCIALSLHFILKPQTSGPQMRAKPKSWQTFNTLGHRNLPQDLYQQI